MEIHKNSVMDPQYEIKSKPCIPSGVALGWNHLDTYSSASHVDDPTKIPPTSVCPAASVDNFTPSEEVVKPAEVLSTLESAYSQFPGETQKAVESLLPKGQETSDLLSRQMELLSKKIDEALSAEEKDYEKIHALVLRFCMIHMRNVVKEDHKYIDDLGQRIMVQSGKVKDSYNTWPVVTITLVSSAVSIVGGVGGFSSIVRPNSEIAKILTTHAHGISTMSTGISSAGSLVSSGNERDRGVHQLTLRRIQDKEEEKKGSKNSTKESQKGFRTAIEEWYRNMRDVVRSVLGG